MKIMEEGPRFREKISDWNEGQQRSMFVLEITHQETRFLWRQTGPDSSSQALNLNFSFVK